MHACVHACVYVCVSVCVSHHDYLLQGVVLVWPRVDSELAINWHDLPVNHLCLHSEADCKVVLVGAGTHDEGTRAEG